MTSHPKPPFRLGRAALLACLLALLTAAVAAPAAAAATYTHESKEAYEHQLAAGEIAHAKINKRVRHVDMTLKNGSLVLYTYPPKEEPAVLSQLQAKNVPVEVLSASAAKAEAKKPVHHKLRYIVGGIALVVVLIIIAVLVVDRRRKALAD